MSGEGLGRLVFHLADSQATKELGACIASCLFPGLAILLEGDLGAGKTTLVAGLGEALGWSRISSPTFAIVNEYGTRPPLAHVDLYRLESVDERDFGLNDYLDDGWVLALEWPDRLKDMDFMQVWRLEFLFLEKGRQLIIEAQGEEALRALKRLEERCGC